MPIPAIPTPITCPQCGNRFVVQVRSVVDVGEDPGLRGEFLRGRLNVARCNKCGAGGALATPIVYHDPSKELLVTYVPTELNMDADQREKLVGSLVTAVMNSTPQEQRKGYFFQPRTALTMEGLYDMVLEAEGISKEALAKQRATLRLVTSLLEAAEDDEALDRLVEEHRQELDYEFFLFLSSMMEPAPAEEGEEPEPADEEQVRALASLREKLLDRVTPRMPGAAPEGAGYDEIIAILRDSMADDALTSAVAVNRQRLDYGFFQALTAKIDAAQAAGNADEAQALTDLRTRINEELDRQEDLLRAAEDQASLLIMEISDEEDIEAAVREHRGQVNEIFLSVLTRLIAAAGDRQSKRAQKLRRILDASLAVLEESMPPETRLINRLARAEHPEETATILDESRDLLTERFLQRYDETVSSLEERNSDLADHLKAVREQIVERMPATPDGGAA